ncbi:lipid asymmetry maintenance protein MlaB [Vogesella sp. LIG4]|uniref:STAS domain-containing protein n=1 Tax=Vogesella sp. LIG4 TaxID=1192162 RepID=UPI00081F9310|nr:STAS domain-containing protein [Vogesella sp. LIG4]SCK17125.1 phospholipid transport system transporter-binding protein [Vogesella sp. LIG4]
MSLSRPADGQLALSGILDMDTVAGIQPQLMQAMQGGKLRLDLSAVDKADAAALAMLLGALRQQQQRGGELVLQHLPASLASQAQLYGVAGLLGMPGEQE